MEEFMNYKVEETPEDPMYSSMYKKMRLHLWRHGKNGPYTYRVKVYPDRSPDRIGYGTISEFYLTDTRTGKEVFRHAAHGLSAVHLDTPESSFVINSIIHFYWNGPPKYTPASTSSDDLEAIKEKLIHCIDSIDAYLDSHLSSVQEEPVTHETLNQLDATFQHLLAAASCLDYMPEHCLKETCEEIWECSEETDDDA